MNQEDQQKLRAETPYPLEKPSGTIAPIQFIQAEDLHDVPVPFVRITTCGGLKVEVLQEIISDTANPAAPAQGRYRLVLPQQCPKGSTTALTLLKMLVSLPQHYAAKDWLAEHLPRLRRDTYAGEDEEEGWERGLVRIDNVVSILRTLLCPSELAEQEVLRKRVISYVKNHRDSGPGYRLAGAPLIWLDVDVLATAVTEAALHEQQGSPGGQGAQKALPLWEQACTLALQGRYLPEEPYSDWAAQRRAEVDGMGKQAVLALRRLLLAQYGQAAEERILLLLRCAWQAHPTDEDLLYPLMELLSQQERYQEAERSYQRYVRLLDEEASGQQPGQRLQRLHEFLQSRQQQQLWSTVNAQRDEGEEGSTPIAQPLHTAPPQLVAGQDKDERSPLASTLARRILEAVSEAVSELEKEKHQTMDTFRRTITVGLLGLLGGNALPLEWWERLAHPHPSGMKTEAFHSFQHLIENGWELCNAGEWQLAERVLESFLPDALTLAPKQREAAILASQGLVLRSILQAHQLNLTAMVALCKQAVFSAKEAGDPTTLCTSLNGLAAAFKYTQHYEESFQASLEALSYCDMHVSPLVRSRVYAGAAAAFAQQGQKSDAERCIQLAYEVFPQNWEHDPHCFSADHGWYMIAYYHGSMYLALNRPQEALQAFERYKEQPASGVPQRNALEIINQQGRAALLSHDLEAYASFLQEGIAGSLALKSKKRLKEAVKIFQEEMPKTWRNHPQITSIIEQYPLLLQETR